MTMRTSAKDGSDQETISNVALIQFDIKRIASGGVMRMMSRGEVSGEEETFSSVLGGGITMEKHARGGGHRLLLKQHTR